MEVEIMFQGPDGRIIRNPREALEMYRHCVPPTIRKNAEEFVQLAPEERDELLFYMNAGIAQVLTDHLNPEYEVEDGAPN